MAVYLGSNPVNMFGGMTPYGTLSITSNGIYDVTDFASVNVETGGGSFYSIYKALAYNESVYDSWEDTVDWANSYSIIEDYAFYYRKLYGSYNFSNCTTVGNYAFTSCSNLASISFSNCTTIGNYAFYNCSRLATVSFPNCTSIGSYAFGYCSSLTNINFPNCTNIGNSAFYYCTNLTNINFPNCTSIGSYAFCYCSSLVSVSLPKCVSIYNHAFRSCRYLISLYLLGSSIVSLGGTSVFYSTPIGGYSTSAGRYGSIFVPSSLYASYRTATYWSAFSTRFVSM